MSCGKIDSKYHAKESIQDWQNLPFADLNHRYDEKNIDIEKIQAVFKRYDIKRKEYKKNNQFR